MSCLILITEILISQRYNSYGGRLCLLKRSLLCSPLSLSSLSDSQLTLSQGPSQELTQGHSQGVSYSQSQALFHDHFHAYSQATPGGA